MSHQLNKRAFQLVEGITDSTDDLCIESHHLPGGGHVLDFGVHAPGSLKAGLALAEVCMAGLAEITTVPGKIDQFHWPHVSVRTDHPVAACLLSQYAGWQISVDKFFAMGSGPMRAVAAVENMFDKLHYQETAEHCIGILEGNQLPDNAVFDFLSEKTELAPKHITLLIAPTSREPGGMVRTMTASTSVNTTSLAIRAEGLLPTEAVNFGKSIREYRWPRFSMACRKSSQYQLPLFPKTAMCIF